ncbi:unnamed protein product [Eruca vesicaria subsp. sativa]|uniref:Uncharacterized protein n=1 Tax=Eruca vesicaria subsp. sativa TaxID=29727 RepID=A0ABC8K5F9_ERUVS|nr:unnamed protein product [Eruca vesicaria subsp. sativa]
MEENVTIRSRSVARSLAYSPNNQENPLHGEQRIDDLNDMDAQEENEGLMMDVDEFFDGEDDLFDDEIKDMENMGQSSKLITIRAIWKE